MRIKALREDRDIKQIELARYCNISQNTYSQYENGVRQIPVDILIKLSFYYNTSVDYLLELTDNPVRYDSPIMRSRKAKHI